MLNPDNICHLSPEAIAAPQRVVAIGGGPGSGKSTLATSLASELGYRCFSVGEIVRRQAIRDQLALNIEDERGLLASQQKIRTTAQTTYPDQVAMRFVRKYGDSVVASHFFPFTQLVDRPKGYDPFSINIFLACELNVSSGRIRKRGFDLKGLNLPRIISFLKGSPSHTLLRAENNVQRLNDAYDFAFPHPADLNSTVAYVQQLLPETKVIDTTDLSIEEVFQIASGFVKSRLTINPR